MLYSADVFFIYSRDMSFSPYDICRATSKKREKSQKVRMLIFRFSDPRPRQKNALKKTRILSCRVRIRWDMDKNDKKNTCFFCRLAMSFSV